MHRIAREGVLGTSSELVVAASSEQDVDHIEQAVFGEVARLDAVLSTWDDGSELARLSKAGHGAASVDLLAVFELAAPSSHSSTPGNGTPSPHTLFLQDAVQASAST